MSARVLREEGSGVRREGPVVRGLPDAEGRACRPVPLRKRLLMGSSWRGEGSLKRDPEYLRQERAIAAFRWQWIAEHHGAEPEDDDVPQDVQWANLQEVRRLSGRDPQTGLPLGDRPEYRRRRQRP